MFVLDCSVTMAWCFEDEEGEYATEILKKLSYETAIVPRLWHLEVMNTLLIGERRKRLNIDRSKEFFLLLQKLDIHTDTIQPDITDLNIVKIAREYQLTAYDAVYLALALRENLRVATLDNNLQTAAQTVSLYKEL